MTYAQPAPLSAAAPTMIGAEELVLPETVPPQPKDPPLDHGKWRDAHAAQVARNVNLDLRVLWGLFQTTRYAMSDVPARELIPAPIVSNAKPHLPAIRPLIYACKVGVVNLIVEGT